MKHQLTPASIKKFLGWILFLLVFFYFIQVNFVQAVTHDKLFIQTRKGGNGFSLRMRWGSLELWQVKHKTELKKIFPLNHFDPVGKLEKYTN